MNKNQITTIAAIIIVGILFGAFVLFKGNNKAADEASVGHVDSEHHAGKDGEHKDEKGDADATHHKNGPTKGPHGGQLYAKGDIGLEILLAEEGGDPRFVVYLSRHGKAVPPTSGKVTVALTRPDGQIQDIAFSPEKDAMKSTTAIAEPHVFEATIHLQTGKESLQFPFSKEEGKIELTDAQIKSTGVTLQSAGAAQIKSALQMPGEIRFNEDRTAHVVPRVTGIVESVHADLGQSVKKGAVLAVITSTALSEHRSELLAARKRLDFARTTYEREKKLWEEKISAQQDYLQAQQALREAEIAMQNAQQKLIALGAGTATAGPLNRFEVRAPFDGMIVEKHIALGETVKEDSSIFTLSDLSTVWAEITVPPKDIDHVRIGATAVVRATASDSKAAGKVSYVGSLIGEQTRSAKARVVLSNPKMAWRPGLYVNVELIADEVQVAVAVATDAIQSVNEKPVVFMRIPGGFVAQPVVTGRTDGKQIEIVRGLRPGVQYAAAGSFVIKAELGKGSAEHEH